ncbi:unnamed protein product [Citrullus colocynthis]|uniref:Uncharacterized protein n=1 Tax=Citrullus colocynthis TaxID=252529 RepID=A0ABP0YJD8_9ROSI
MKDSYFFGTERFQLLHCEIFLIVGIKTPKRCRIAHHRLLSLSFSLSSVLIFVAQSSELNQIKPKHFLIYKILNFSFSPLPFLVVADDYYLLTQLITTTSSFFFFFLSFFFIAPSFFDFA